MGSQHTDIELCKIRKLCELDEHAGEHVLSVQLEADESCRKQEYSVDLALCLQNRLLPQGPSGLELACDTSEYITPSTTPCSQRDFPSHICSSSKALTPQRSLAVAETGEACQAGNDADSSVVVAGQIRKLQVLHSDARSFAGETLVSSANLVVCRPWISGFCLLWCMDLAQTAREQQRVLVRPTSEESISKTKECSQQEPHLQFGAGVQHCQGCGESVTGPRGFSLCSSRSSLKKSSPEFLKSFI